MSIALLAVVVTFVVFALLLLRIRADSTGSIAAPPALPIFGHTFLLLKRVPDLNDFFTECAQKYRGTFAVSMMGQQCSVWTTKPENCEHILKTNFDNYVKGEKFHEKFHELLGNGIFAVDGKEWFAQRKTAAHLFNVKNFRDNMLNVFVDHAKQLLDILEDACVNKKTIDMHDLFFRYTLDCIGEIGFGVEINSLGGESQFARSFDGAQAHCQSRFLSPFWKLKKLYSKEEELFRNQVETLDSYAREVVRSRKASGDFEERYDLLSIFMSRKDNDGKDYSDDFLRDLIMNFVIAGRDTTGQALSWMFYQLSQNPKIADLISDELDTVLDGDPPNFQTIKQLKYTDAVFSETVRLHPSVPKDGKFALKDDVWPDGTPIKAGSFVGYLPYAMARDTNLWGPDAASFNPDRWIADDFEKPSQFKFISFQGKSAAAMILQKYRLHLAPGHVVKAQTNITLPMEYGLKMTVTRK